MFVRLTHSSVAFLYPENRKHLDFLMFSGGIEKQHWTVNAGMKQEMKVNTIQLLTVDLLARASMKNVASCDK